MCIGGFGMNGKSSNIVMTFNDVIVHDGYDMYLYFVNHFEFYGRFLNIYKPLLKKSEFYGRRTPDALKWLMESGPLSKMAESDKRSNERIMMEAIRRDYRSKDIYSHMKPTKFAMNTLGNALLQSGADGHATTILLRPICDAHETAYQRRFLEKWFGNGAGIKIVELPQGADYAAEVMSRFPEYGLFVTDDSRAVASLAKGDADHREFLLPKYGYDELEERDALLIKAKNGSLNYYFNGE